MVSRLLLQILWDLFGRSLLGNGPFNSFLLLPCMASKSSLSNNLGLVAELHLHQSSDLLGHQVQKSFVYSRDFWKTNDKRPLVIQSPYISHQYYLKYLQSSDLLDQWIQKSFEYSRNFCKPNGKLPFPIQTPYNGHQYNLRYLRSYDLLNH